MQTAKRNLIKTHQLQQVRKGRHMGGSEGPMSTNRKGLYHDCEYILLLKGGETHDSFHVPNLHTADKGIRDGCNHSVYHSHYDVFAIIVIR